MPLSSTVPPALSVIVITRDEAADIDQCLSSTRFADEWIVVDCCSVDDTVARARAFGARVIETSEWPGFGAQKQRALDEALGRWVLSIDADERVTPELAASIGAVVGADGEAGADVAGYELARLSRFAGRWIRHGDWYPDPVLRLFRRERGRFTLDRVHERVIVDGAVARLPGDLRPETMPPYCAALAKLDRYSTEVAALRAAAGQRGGVGKALCPTAWAFLRSYVLRLGFLDGAAGFAVACYVAEGTWWRYLKIEDHAR